jgi:superfamily II DNA or RNA helicase
VTRVRIGARVELTDLPRETELGICSSLTRRNPEHERRVQRGLSTYNTDATISTWERIPGGISVPRGTASQMVALLRAEGVPYTVEDATVCPPLEIDATPTGVLRPYQQAAVERLLAHLTGVCCMPTGSGKGSIIADLPARLKTPTLILVHSMELLRQTVARCRSWLGIEVGIIGDGRWDVRAVTVGTTQTLARRLGTPEMAALAGHVGLLIMDECHRAPAMQSAAVLDALPARHRFGMTATPFRRDGLDMVITDYLGPITARVTPDEVRAAGATVAPRVEIVETAWRHTMSDAPHAWGQMLSALVLDETRNDLLTREVRRRLDARASVLVLTDRVAHVEALAHLLRDRAPVVLHGGLSPAERVVGMQMVRDGAGLTLATSQLLAEGIDCPAWDTLVMASPMAGGPRYLQAIGRVVRPAAGKHEAVIVDVVDVHVPALRSAYYARRRLYREAA